MSASSRKEKPFTHTWNLRRMFPQEAEAFTAHFDHWGDVVFTGTDGRRLTLAEALPGLPPAQRAEFYTHMELMFLGHYEETPEMRLALQRAGLAKLPLGKRALPAGVWGHLLAGARFAHQRVLYHQPPPKKRKKTRPTAPPPPGVVFHRTLAGGPRVPGAATTAAYAQRMQRARPSQVAVPGYSRSRNAAAAAGRTRRRPRRPPARPATTGGRRRSRRR